MGLQVQLNRVVRTVVQVGRGAVRQVGKVVDERLWRERRGRGERSHLRHGGNIEAQVVVHAFEIVPGPDCPWDARIVFLWKVVESVFEDRALERNIDDVLRANNGRDSDRY